MLNQTIFLYHENVREKIPPFSIKFSSGLLHNHMQSNIIKVNTLKATMKTLFLKILIF